MAFSERGVCAKNVRSGWLSRAGGLGVQVRAVWALLWGLWTV